MAPCRRQNRQQPEKLGSQGASLRTISTPRVPSASCLGRQLRIRRSPQPCSTGTIVEPMSDNKQHRGNLQSRLSSLCPHLGLSRWPFFRPWPSSPLAPHRTVFHPDGQRSTMSPFPLRPCLAALPLPEMKFPSLDLHPDLATRAAK